MNNNCKHALTSYLKEINGQYVYQKKRLRDLEGYVSYKLKVKQQKNGRNYYSVRVPGQKEFKYLGCEKNRNVQLIKEAHYLALSVQETEREIKMIKDVLRLSPELNYGSINNRLQKAYRDALLPSSPSALPKNSSAYAKIAKEWKLSMEKYKDTFPPFRPEELIHLTHDGTYVRSKNEALIYNHLLDIGLTFVYELPLRIRYENKNTLLLPDFTILSEIDYKTVIIIEHQGMMSNQSYRNKFNDSVYKYWLNNYMPERDVFFTFDLPNGGFDDTPIRNIISQHIRPGS